MSALELHNARQAAINDRAFILRVNRVLATALAAVTLILVLTAGGLAVILIRGAPPPVVVASTADGRIIPIKGLDEPLMSDTAMKLALARAISKTFTLGYHDWEERLEEARQFYAIDAWSSLMEEFEQVGFLQRLRETYQTVTVLIEGTPKLIDREVFQGTLYLKFATPVSLTWRVSG